MEKNIAEKEWLLPVLYIVGRLMLYLGLTWEKISSHGDLLVYYDIARLDGWPFFDHWIEYPPLFAFVNELIYWVCGGSQSWYLFLITGLLAVCGAVILFFFQRIAARLFGREQGFFRTVLLFGLLVSLMYAWEYFDPLALVFMIMGLYWIIAGKDIHAGLALGIGMLAKWFPGFVLAAVLRFRPPRKAIYIALAALSLVVLVLGALWAISPEMTAASLAAQPGRSSWQTVWAYLDGNRVSGAFIYWDFRLDPAQAYIQRGNPARIPRPLSVAIFGLLGLFFFWQVKNCGDRSLVAFTGITFAVFLMWSPGWSPQWILYLLPLILLTFPVREGLVIALALIGITLLEWPTFLGQFWFRGVFAMAGLRMILLVLLTWCWFKMTQEKERGF